MNFVGNEGVPHMYLLKIMVTIALAIGFLISLAYYWINNHKLMKKQATKHQTMKNIFISTFCAWLSIFAAVFVWQDKSSWDISAWLFFIAIALLFSIMVAFFAALSLWSWKE